jgi:hypothetical protein
MYAVVDVVDGKSQVVVAVADCSQNSL